MLRDECILCFAPDLWSDIWRNRHRLLGILAEQNRVLYVEPRNSLGSIRRRLGRGKLRWRDFFAPRVEEVRENLFVYHDPLHLPRSAKPVVGAFVERRREASLRRVLRGLGFERPILWLVRPDSFDTLGRYDEKAVLYQIVDDYFSFPNEKADHKESMRRREAAILAAADLVVVTSQSLLAQKRGQHDNVQLVRNAVDSATLAAARRDDLPVPEDIGRLPRPVLGYLGGVTNKIDLELLEKVARRFEGRGSLAFVGPLRVTADEDRLLAERLRALPAVHFLGKKDATDVPAYVRAMDVCLVPYRLGDQTQAIDPLKLYEYLAFGKPVVAADIPSVRELTDVVHVARDHDEYLDLIERAVEESAGGTGAEDLAARRRRVAEENTWEARVETISAHLERVLAARSAGARAAAAV